MVLLPYAGTVATLETIWGQNKFQDAVWYFIENVRSPLVRRMEHMESKVRLPGCDPGKDSMPPFPDL